MRSLPNNVVESLYTAFNAQYDSKQQAAFVDCNLANQQGSLEFTFSGPTISVPLNELVIVAGYSRGRPVCILGIGPADNSVCVLGDTFLRSAYVVYDLENNQIGIAQTNFNATRTSVQEITSGKNAIPNASEVANAVSSVAVGTGGGRIGGPNVSAGTSTGAAMPARTPNVWLGAGAAFAGAGMAMGFTGM